MAAIRELPTAPISKFERIGAHTHIKGFRLRRKLEGC
jgi:hypothetical protein